MGPKDVTETPPAFYARTGSTLGDVVTLFHLPYTAWHLSYVAIGAAMAPDIDWLVLGGTLSAFAFGLGVGAHALDELHDRPLSTALSSRMLSVLGWGGLAAGGVLAIVAAWVISPVALVWGAVGVLLAAAYALEWSSRVHSTIGFALAWGGFPVLVGYWAQTESISIAVVVLSAAAALFSIVQRNLSTPARRIRRTSSRATVRIGDEPWDEEDLLATWERPLLVLAIAHVVTAVALVSTHLGL